MKAKEENKSLFDKQRNELTAGLSGVQAQMQIVLLDTMSRKIGSAASPKCALRYLKNYAVQDRVANPSSRLSAAIDRVVTEAAEGEDIGRTPRSTGLFAPAASPAETSKPSSPSFFSGFRRSG